MLREAWGNKHLSSHQIALEVGMTYKCIFPYIKHMKDAGSLEEFGRTGGGRGGVMVTYRHTGIYAPPQVDLPDVPTAHVGRMPVHVFRDALCVAFFGEAKVTAATVSAQT